MMINQFMNNPGPYSTGAIVGMTVVALVGLGIFATRAEVAEQRAWVAESYMPRSEIKGELRDINKKIDLILVKVYKGE